MSIVLKNLFSTRYIPPPYHAEPSAREALARALRATLRLRAEVVSLEAPSITAITGMVDRVWVSHGGPIVMNPTRTPNLC